VKGVFITGTSTSIGKTTYANWLMERHLEATYWKPVQTG
jgi:dethiobiotin synthetase